MIPMRSDLVLSKAQTWKVIMFTQGDVLRLKEGVDLSSGNSFFTQPERTNPRVSSGIWLAAFIALLVGLLSPAGSGWVMGAGAQLPKCFLWLFVVMSVLRSCRLSGWKTGLCGSNPSYRFDLWVLARVFFLSFFSSCGQIRVFQNWLTRGQRTGMQRAQRRLPNRQTHHREGENTPGSLPPRPIPEEKSPCDLRITLQAKSEPPLGLRPEL